MGLEIDLKTLGFKLSRPLSCDCYDFAYRTEGMTDASRMRGQALLRSVGVLEEQVMSGYTNVQVDLWKLHAVRGWPEASYQAIRSGTHFEEVMLRARYIKHLLEPHRNTLEGPLDQDLRGLLQRIHFPVLYRSLGEDLGQAFWNLTLNRNLRNLPDFTQGQIYCICDGFCECSKTGTCAQ